MHAHVGAIVQPTHSQKVTVWILGPHFFGGYCCIILALIFILPNFNLKTSPHTGCSATTPPMDFLWTIEALKRILPH